MVIRKRKKNSRARGQWSHGWGAKKKHRGSGHRGGKGNAGSGKRADSKKPSIWKDVKYFGKHGFVYHGRKEEQNCINVSDVDGHAQKWIAEKKAAEKGGEIAIDLASLGFTKLLGTGKAKRKYIITVNSASRKAIDAISAAGGKVIIQNGNMEQSGKQSS
ncbi:uL15 family ribosomal protein [Candidatus Woesearchaeota archaeon]|nr:uL15 family ribosomal protein [Candidatus Woesearchaeota archaeon]